MHASNPLLFAISIASLSLLAHMQQFEFPPLSHSDLCCLPSSLMILSIINCKTHKLNVSALQFCAA